MKHSQKPQGSNASCHRGERPIPSREDEGVYFKPKPMTYAQSMHFMRDVAEGGITEIMQKAHKAPRYSEAYKKGRALAQEVSHTMAKIVCHKWWLQRRDSRPNSNPKLDPKRQEARTYKHCKTPGKREGVTFEWIISLHRKGHLKMWWDQRRDARAA